jgi:tRNA nucleotidyltransferase (CCA-adding enzyme)
MGWKERAQTLVRPKNTIVQAAAIRAVDALKDACKTAKVELAGSVAKGTWLEDDCDIDVFLLLPKDTPKDKFGQIARSAAEAAFPDEAIIECYSQHPYVRVRKDGIDIDVVPAYLMSKGDKQVLSAVDRSQLHTKYVTEKLRDGMHEDVRMLKRFLKCAGVYGAEIRVQGFSGYMCELLAISCGGFEKALAAIAQWKERDFLDLAWGISRKDGLQRFSGNLVCIDPVDYARNAASAVGPETYFRAISAARGFIAAPQNSKYSFFEYASASGVRKASGKRNLHTLALKIPDDVNEEVCWGQARRVFNLATDAMAREGFSVMGRWAFPEKGNIVFIFETAQKKLDPDKIILGPPMWMAEDCKKFLARKTGAINHEGRVCAYAKRDFTELAGCARKILPVAKKIAPWIKHIEALSGSKAVAKYPRTVAEYLNGLPK